MSSMKTLADERGELNVLLIPVILVSLLFVGAGAFAAWAYSGKQDYKNNVDTKISAAVATNKKVVQTADAQQFAEAAKKPLKTYVGPEAYGSLKVSYPKTWSGYVVASSDSGDNPVDGYFYPDVVPSVTDNNSVFALRVQISAQSYSQALDQFSSQLEQNTVTIVPYSLPKLSSVVGVRVDGQIAENKQGSMIILPLRDKTLQIWTESGSFLNDFNNNILPNITFSP